MFLHTYMLDSKHILSWEKYVFPFPLSRIFLLTGFSCFDESLITQLLFILENIQTRKYQWVKN